MLYKDLFEKLCPRIWKSNIPCANAAISNCNVLFSIGTRFNDRITGKVEEFAVNAKIIHIDVDAASISRNTRLISLHWQKRNCFGSQTYTE